MIRKRFTAEQIIGTLREAEVEFSRGLRIKEVSPGLGITEQTYYRWPKYIVGPKCLRLDL